MSRCHGCGDPIPPSRGGAARKWCSERCRKAQYAGRCVDCGAATNGSNGRGPSAPKRCSACSLRHQQESAKWTRGSIVAAIRAWVSRHGTPPGARTWLHAGPAGEWPPLSTVQRVFGSWTVAIAAAGYTPNATGRCGRPGDLVDTDEIVRLYVRERLTQRQIARRLGCCEPTVRRRLRDAQAPIRRPGPRPSSDLATA
jgi:hypothetical protein